MAPPSPESEEPLYRQEEWLHQKYVVEELTQEEIGDIAGVSQGCIGRKLRKNDIPTRQGTNGNMPSQEAQNKLNDPDWLYKQYATNGRTQDDIANELSVSQNYVSRKLREADVKTRRGTYIHPPSVQEKLSNPLWLYNQHYVKEKSTTEIANNLGVAKQTASNNMERLGIDRRGKSRTVFSRTCPYCEEEFQTDVSDDTNYCSFDCYRKSSDPTSIERIGWSILDEIGVEYKKEHEVAGYWADAYLPSPDICVEFDGEYWHGHPDTKPWTDEQISIRHKDSEKNKRLLEEGHHVIRIWGRHLNEDVNTVREELSDTIRNLGGEAIVQRVP